MKDADLQVIKRTSLFKNISNFKQSINCLQPIIKNYSKGEIIIIEGSSFPYIGILLDGNAVITKTDYDGNETILTNLTRSDFFGEAFALANHPSLVNVIATNDVRICLFSVDKILNRCSSSCNFHNQLIKNLLVVNATKNIKLNQRIEIISKSKTKEKILCYLEQLSLHQNNKSVVRLPFSKTELAKFLCVDRSAMSREISKMGAEGIISVAGRKVTIL